MIKCNIMLVFSIFFFLSIVLQCNSLFRTRCPTFQLKDGSIRYRSNNRIARISCSHGYVLVRGNDRMTCVGGEWDSELPLCATTGCSIKKNIPNGRLRVLYEGAKLEVLCEPEYIINGPSSVYCYEKNRRLEWNEEIKGCKEQDRILLSCNFESTDERFCGWINDNQNNVDWLADKLSYLFPVFGRRHVTPGSSQYFAGNYISLDTGYYGISSSGKLISPTIPPLNDENKQRCLEFGYKVIEISYGSSKLTVFFGGIPHWSTSEGEGKAIIGLYKLNVTAQIIIEGKNCKAAIDNLIILEGNGCAQPPYEEEVFSCHDNCGKISSGTDCSCDWECFNNENCCADIRLTCPYIKPFEEIAMLYLTTTTSTTISTTSTTTTTTTNTVTPTHLITVVDNNTHSSHITLSSKMINESKVPNEPITVTTPINKYMTNINNTSISTVLPSIFVTKFTNSTILHPVTLPTTKIITISSMTSSTEIPKPKTLSLNSTLSVHGVPDSTKKSLIITFLNESRISSNKTVSFPNTSPTFINTMNSTIKPFTIHSSSVTKLVDLTSTSSKFLMVNTSRNFTTSTNKPLLINTYNSSIKPPILYFETSTIKLIDTLGSITKLIIENTTSTPKSINPSTIINLPIEFNNSSTVKQFNTIIHNIKPETNSSTSSSKFPDYLNIPTVSSKEYEVFDIDKQNPDLMVPYKYNTTLKNNQTSLNNNSLPNVTTKYSDRTVLQNITFWKNINSTTVSSLHEKSLSNYSISRKNKWLAKNGKNLNAKSENSFNTFTIIKYIATIGVVIVTFKFILSLIKWYFIKPSDDDMSACFVETNEEDLSNIELTPSRVQ